MSVSVCERAARAREREKSERVGGRERGAAGGGEMEVWLRGSWMGNSRDGERERVKARIEGWVGGWREGGREGERESRKMHGRMDGVRYTGTGAKDGCVEGARRNEKPLHCVCVCVCVCVNGGRNEKPRCSHTSILDTDAVSRLPPH